METQTEAVTTVPEQDATAAPDAVDTVTQVEETPVEEKLFTQAEVNAINAKTRREAERRVIERERAARVANEQPKPIDPAAFEQMAPEQQQEVLVDHRARQLVQEQKEQARLFEIDKAFRDREATVKDKYADYEQIAHSAAFQLSNPMAEAIKTSELGPEVAYYLGSNLDEADRILSLTPVQQVREISKLEVKLASEPVKNTTSSAPAPITPVTRGSSARIIDTLDPRATKSMTPEEWILAENARVRRKYESQRA